MNQPTTKPRKTQRLLLSRPRRQPLDSAAEALRATLAPDVATLIARVTAIDSALERLHVVVQELMAGAPHSLGVEWVPHKTRPGLHPVVYKTRPKGSIEPFTSNDGSKQERRPWCVVIRPGYLMRHLSCMPGQEKRVLKHLEPSLLMLRDLLHERVRILDSLGAVRSLVTKRLDALDGRGSTVGTQTLESQSAGLRARLVNHTPIDQNA